ncbi:MAG: GGDEF domain-containing protein [Pedobacter sp.]|nr:GGDEF domain-containing protein [Pedobacter sp.]
MTPPLRVTSERVLYESALQASRSWHWRLPWTGQLETDFQQYYAGRYRSQMVLGLVVGALAILVSAFEDFLIPAGQREILLFIRLGLVLPAVLVLAWLISRPALSQWQQFILMLSTLGGAAAFLLMAFFVTSSFGRIYIDTLMLIQIFGLTLLRQQFSYAAVCVLLIVAVASAVLLLPDFPGAQSDKLIGLMLIVFAGLLCLVANYMMERSARLDYLQQRLLEQGQQDLEKANSHLQQLLRSDALTGIANRRHFDARLDEEFRRAARSHTPVALLMVDVDSFKQYNDSYGHQAGDDALTRVAQSLALFARRPGDVAARYGGEEFALILPGSSEADALAIAEEVVTYVYEQNMPHRTARASDRVTVSIGVAALQSAELADVAELIAQADQALYFAKSSGRNRARSWSALQQGSGA